MKKVFCKILEVLIIAIIIMQFNVIVYANEIQIYKMNKQKIKKK